MLANVEEWRAKQNPVPKLSEAIRRLVKLGEGEEMISARSWTADDDEQLRALLAANRHVAVIARKLKRTEASVLARGYKLGLRLCRQKSLGLAARKTVAPLKMSPPGTNAIDD